MTDKTSLLPANVSDLERDLEIALARLEDIEIPIATLWNPWKCPLEVLPFLAWAVSVDLWRSDWLESVKRSVVANSMSGHRRKGTRPAVEQALNALGVTVELVEWFEMSPQGQPGTFEVTAWANKNITPDEVLLTPDLYDQLKATVDNAKNTRSHYSFSLGAKFDSGIQVGMAGTGSAAVCRRQATAKQSMLRGQCGIGVAGHVQGAMVVYRKMEAK